MKGLLMIRRVWPILVLLLLASASQAVDPRAATPLPDHLTLTWTGSPATTQTITWRTDDTVRSGRVQYQAGRQLTAPKEAPAAVRAFATDLQATRLFTATVAGLTPNTTYTYRVGDGTRWSKPHAFTTADPKATRLSFLVFGDSQSAVGGYAEWGRTVRQATRAYPAAKFMVNVGDLVDVGQSGAHWNAWFAAAADVLDTLPEMPVVGNHEGTSPSRAAKATAPEPRFLKAQFALPQNGPAGLKDQAYSFDYGPVHCVMLDTQADLKAQRTWLETDLAASKAPWKIAFLHQPPYAAQPVRPNPGVKAAFCPVFDRYHVNLVFMGHDHAVTRTYPLNHGGPVAKPSQGTIYCMAGRSGQKTYGYLFQQSDQAYFHNPQQQPNYLVVEVAGPRLVVKAVQQDGTVLDTFVLDRENDVSSDGAPPGRGN